MMLPGSHRKFSKLKLFLLNWACVLPLVLLLETGAKWVLHVLRLPESVLPFIVTGLLTFATVYFIGPWLERTFRSWLTKP
ncbi:hypothetical protein [uncultured Hymenobacter sp.]|uniref:hypothetical protein n=1 Tax=uncultured Hymenobacter sp. TaxID=170016 RepID=UPI0035C97F58